MELSLELEALLALLESPRAPPLLAWRPVACGDDAPGALVQEAVFDLPAPPAAGAAESDGLGLLDCLGAPADGASRSRVVLPCATRTW